MEFDRHYRKESFVNIERKAVVADILAQHKPFKNEPFQPRPTLARVYTRPKSWFGRVKKLHPVAFMTQITMIDTMGCISSFGSVYPYLWVDADARLISRAASGKFMPVDIDALTTEDIANLAIGIQGNSDLLDAEYEKAHEAMLAERERM